jgi:hypothetical protein
MYRLLLLLSLSLAGCGAARPEPDIAPLPLDETVGGSGLVWLVGSDGRSRTLWVSLEDGRPLASQPIDGPLWSIGPRLWQWIEEPVEVPLYDCSVVSSERAPNDAASIGTGTLSRVILRDVTETLDVELRAAPSLEPMRWASDSIHPIASVGPYVFVVEAMETDTCGAHGSAQVESYVWDLGNAQRAEILSPIERSSLAGAEERTARLRLIEEIESGELADELGEIQLAALWPAWDLHDGLGLEYVFTADSCYACSDGEWSSYTIATRVEAAALPAALAAHGQLPAWVRLAVARIEDARVAGFSVVEHEAPATALDTLRR